MSKRRPLLLDLLLLLIITIPTFTSLINNQYFTIHDNQHVVRLYLLDQGIKQGYLYPRWVDQLSFGFGDPLFNFYPPLVYYLAEVFHLTGFSLIWSVKLIFILGFLTGGLSMFWLVKEYLGRLAGFLGATIYNYFFYHAINAYVRGALSEFFAMSLVPLVLLFFHRLSKDINLKNSLWFAVTLALVFLSHQLVALPLVIFLFLYLVYYLLIIKKERWQFFRFLSFGGLLGLGLSAFYWLPMFIEKNYTFIDQELGGYKQHYIDPYQFWYSPWGFGGSVKGLGDGMSFQLGKIPILIFFVSTCLFIVYWFRFKKVDQSLKQLLFFVFLFVFSLFMATNYSSFIWDNFPLLWNLQFPWRFMVFTAIFISLVGSYSVYFLTKLLTKNSRLKFILVFVVVFFVSLTIFKYQKYFQPQAYLNVTDKDLTTIEEITWTQSKTVVHFIPKGAKAKKNQYGVYVLDIDKKDLPKQIYEIKSGHDEVKILENKFADKKFIIDAKTPTKFQLNTFNFPGWNVYLDNRKQPINDNNDYKLISLTIPKGEHELKFLFQNTPIRILANIISIASLIIIFIYIVKKK